MNDVRENCWTGGPQASVPLSFSLFLVCLFFFILGEKSNNFFLFFCFFKKK